MARCESYCSKYQTHGTTGVYSVLPQVQESRLMQSRVSTIHRFFSIVYRSRNLSSFIICFFRYQHQSLDEILSELCRTEFFSVFDQTQNSLRLEDSDLKRFVVPLCPIVRVSQVDGETGGTEGGTRRPCPYRLYGWFYLFHSTRGPCRYTHVMPPVFWYLGPRPTCDTGFLSNLSVVASRFRLRSLP